MTIRKTFTPISAKSDTSSDSSPESFVEGNVDTNEEKEVQTMYRNFYGRGEYKFAIYPSYWKDSWVGLHYWESFMRIMNSWQKDLRMIRVYCQLLLIVHLSPRLRILV